MSRSMRINVGFVKVIVKSNLTILRRMALNALNQEKTLQRSLRQKIKQAAMNNDYMMTVLNSFCQA